MSFATENRTVLQLFQKSAVYMVPRYQRDYVWKEINWSELLTDIKFTTDSMGNMSWSHFLGTVVLSDSDEKLGGNKDAAISYFEIIDGQQRLTTLYFMFLAIHRQLSEIDTQESSNRANYVYNTYLTTLQSDNKRVSKIKNDDHLTDMHEMIDYAKNIDGIVISNANIYKNVFTYFKNFFDKMKFEEIDVFLNKLLEINIVEIISDQEEEIYNIFEVLNARGQKLKQFELLKNHIMKYIHPRTDAFVDLAKQKWAEITERSEVLSDTDSLINHFARCYIKKRAENVNSVYKLIKEEIPVEKLSEFLNDLDEFSKAYIEISKTDSIDPTVEYFNIKKNIQVRSLLAAMLILEEKQIISKEIRESSFLNLRNFFFIFNASQQTSNKTDKLIGNTSYNIYLCKTEVEYKMLMTDFFTKLGQYISEETFSSVIVNNQSFRYSNKDSTLKRNSRLVKYTLVQLAQKLELDSSVDYKDMTIEHINLDNGNSDNAFLGNLTITSAHLNNTILKNKNVSEKVQILSEDSSLKINKQVSSFYNPETQQLDIESRGTAIFRELYNTIFKFDTFLFNLNLEDVNNYNKNYEIVKADLELTELLKETGKFFENRLKSDGNLSELNEKFEELKNK